MNDKYYNKFIIEYLYPEYVHNYFRKNEYRYVDNSHPMFDKDTYYVVQLLLHADSNIKIIKFHVNNNMFLNKTSRLSMMHVINKIQIIKQSLRTFIKLCKFKIYKRYNDRNLCGDEFTKKKIELIEHKRVYVFDLYELRKIVNNSFTWKKVYQQYFH
jgi:hypothetical protein